MFVKATETLNRSSEVAKNICINSSPLPILSIITKMEGINKNNEEGYTGKEEGH